MILHPPAVTEDLGEIVISSRIDLSNPLPNLPETLWFRYKEQHRTWLHPRSDGFSPTALLVAMYAGEDLHIHGPISPKLAYGLQEYRNVFHAWRPNIFKKVEIYPHRLEVFPQSKGPTGVAAAFSGGVDSFYTLWSHLPQNQDIPDARVTHALFVHGLDLRLDDPTNFQAAAQGYQQLLQDMGVELIQAATNAFLFSEFRIDWVYFHGAPMIGAAMLMSPFIKRYYIPSGYPSFTKLVPNGVSPLTDHLLNTESLDIIHHGAETSRFEKISVLVNWPATHHRLRVCADKQRLDVFENCSSCHKCYRTMTILTILDSMGEYKNFSKKLTFRDYLRWGFLTHLNLRHARDIRSHAWQAGKYQMVLMIQGAILLRKIKKILVAIVKNLVSRETLYCIKRKVYKPEGGIERR
jgi:hypothetical protein